MLKKVFQKVSQAPTRPKPEAGARKMFDVADLYRGPLDTGTRAAAAAGLDEKLRQAYFWIVNHAVISPHYDIEYNTTPPQRFTVGDGKVEVTLPSGQSYSSFVLMPLLNFAVRRRCLLVGGPGRGKTASAVLMGLLAGYPLDEVHRAIQHGQPQMTISDLLGNPLPADLINAQKMDDIRISWRKWLGMRVKIIDEYNRIPTRTQSALLTVLADGYAEILDHKYDCPESAWYLTANDDAGGGTYQVIEALRDRIDVTVHALHFNSRFVRDLLIRVEEGLRPEQVMPSSLVFTVTEMDAMKASIQDVELPAPLRRRLEFFTSQFEFCELGAAQLEYRTKDTVKLGGADFAILSAQDTGRDRLQDLGTQTRNGISVRALMSALEFAKALAWFRGNTLVDIDDLRHVLPFVLADKLAPNHEAPFFDAPGNEVYRLDRVSWIRRLFDLACAEYDRLGLDGNDPVGALQEELGQGLDGLDEAEVRARLVRIERLLAEWARGTKLAGHLYDDLLTLKYIHQRYTNYLAWLQWAR